MCILNQNSVYYLHTLTWFQEKRISLSLVFLVIRQEVLISISLLWDIKNIVVTLTFMGAEKNRGGNSYRIFQPNNIKTLDNYLIQWVALSAKSYINTMNTRAESAHCINIAFKCQSNELFEFQHWGFKEEKVLD